MVAEMKKEMCAQMDVLKKIRKKGKVNGYDVDLAEAQAKDYMDMKHRLDNIETDVSAIKTEQAVQGGKLDLIIKRLNSPVEKERLDGQKWNLLTSIAKHKSAWVILIVMLMAFALSGDRLVKILEKLI
jgi:hypothetical protein